MAFEGLSEKSGAALQRDRVDSMKQEYESFMQITPCPTCKGQRLKKEALAVTVAIKIFMRSPICPYEKLKEFLGGMALTPHPADHR